MNWLQTLAVVFHVLLAVAIVGLVLLQRGKGADAGAGFGAGASGTVFGSRGSASFLSRTTAVLATLFFLTSLGLSYLFSQQKQPTSVFDTLQQEAPAPVAPQSQPGLMPALPETQAPTTSTPGQSPAATTSEPAAPVAPAQQEPAPAGQ
ncbi:MAG TPA: preprotein translocase subunit SecG [Steroidobacteraceae bacterium]|nr:preprotein translocase subunit SecG [Steroidobacteraceae bacterium]